MQMQDRVVLVTGGARGIGRGVCMVMAERGADAVAADLNLEGAQAVAGELERFGHRTGAFQVDVTDSAEIDRMVAGVIERFGRIDVLVNAAGVIGAPGFEDTTRSREEDWDLTFDVNVKGTALTSDAVAVHMKERRSGKIVNIASQAGRGGGGGAAPTAPPRPPSYTSHSPTPWTWRPTTSTSTSSVPAPFGPPCGRG